MSGATRLPELYAVRRVTLRQGATGPAGCGAGVTIHERRGARPPGRYGGGGGGFGLGGEEFGVAAGGYEAGGGFTIRESKGRVEGGLSLPIGGREAGYEGAGRRRRGDGGGLGLRPGAPGSLNLTSRVSSYHLPPLSLYSSLVTDKHTPYSDEEDSGIRSDDEGRGSLHLQTHQLYILITIMSL